MRRRRVLGWGLLICSVIGLALIWLIGSALTAPTNRAVSEPSAPAIAVRLAASDGVAISGSYWPGRMATAPSVLLLHGNGADRFGTGSVQRWLNHAGYAVLAIDLRGHGASGAAAKSFGWFEAADAHAAIAWLRARNPGGRVGVYGASLGGAAALVGPDGPVAADALVLNSVFPDLRTAVHNRIAVHGAAPLAYVIEPLLTYQSLIRIGVSPTAISPITAIRRFRAPVMVVGGGADAYTPPSEAQALFAVAPRGDAIWILDGLSHDQAVGSPPEALRQRLLSFFDEHLRATE